MEENKKVNKEVKNDDRPEKMSYEQLENIAHQLSEQCRQMAANIQERDLTYSFKRLDYLFKVLELRDAIANKDFVEKCATEIVASMTIPETSTKES